MLRKPLDLIESSDVDALVIDEVPEGKSLDYKRDLPGNADGDKKEFLADISSFANTVGGDLIFGVDEQAGVPSTIVGVQSPDLDAEIRRLDGVISSGIVPRIRHTIRRLEHSSGVDLLLLRVEQSWNGPHRVVFKGHDKFYARSSAGKYALDVGELRDAFLRSSTVEERIRLFHESRTIEVAAGRTPVETGEGAKLLLHIIPMSAFSSKEQYDLMPYYSTPSMLEPMSAHGWQHRMTVEGILTYSPLSTGVSSYTHLYRSGIIEAVDGYILNRVHNGRKLIPSVTYEGRLLDFTAKYLKVQQTLGVSPPVFVHVALLNAEGCWMGTVNDFYDMAERYPIDRAVLDLPIVGVDDIAADIVPILRPILDVVWNACGYPASANFDAQGKWAPSRN